MIFNDVSAQDALLLALAGYQSCRQRATLLGARGFPRDAAMAGHLAVRQKAKKDAPAGQWVCRGI